MNLQKVWEDTSSILPNYTIPQVYKLDSRQHSSDEKHLDKPFVKTKITLVNDDCLNQITPNSCLINNASYKKLGGGCKNGRIAQEEMIAYRTNMMILEETVSFDYPLGLYNMLWFENVSLIKDNNFNTIEPIQFDVLTIPAVNWNKRKDEGLYITDTKIQSILDICYTRKVSKIIVTAWGCGVFKNNPKTIAQLFKKWINIYDGCFEEIVFSIIETTDPAFEALNTSNYKIFKEVLGNT
jgi:uncharacterized protein (TIGR02452 family)